MKRIIRNFIALWLVFSIGLFLGEWLFDTALHLYRNVLKVEIIEAVFTGLLVSLLMMAGNKALRRNG